MKIHNALFSLLVVATLITPRVTFAATEIQEVTSSKGITAWLMEDHTNPMITLSLMLRNGASSDPANLTGQTMFLSGMLDEGAGKLNSRTFQKALEDKNISLGFRAGRDSFSGRLQTLTSHSKEAFNLLRLALTEPRFDPEPMERMRGIFQAQLRQRQENPSARAADAMLHTLFKGHPYARPTSGTKSGLAAVTSRNLKDFMKNRFAKDQLIISVVGDITAKELAKRLDSTFGALPNKANLSTIPNVQPILDGKTHNQFMPVPQANALFAQKGPARNDPDWHAFQVMMYILGDGGFSSRLTEEVREKRGLAYGVGANANPLKHSPLVIGSVGTQSAKIDESIEIIRKEWARMQKFGPTPQEVEKAKSYIVGSLPLRLNSSRAIANTLTALQYYHLPKDALEKRPAVINAITVQDVKRVAQKWLTPNKLTMFVVGDIRAKEIRTSDRK